MRDVTSRFALDDEQKRSASKWRRAIDTSLPSPLDILGLDEGPLVLSETTYHVAAHSMIVLIAEP